MDRFRTLAVALGVALLAAGCGGGEEEEARPSATRASPIVPLDSGTVRIETAGDTVLLSVEIAETDDQTQIGLMDRDSLPQDEGMIFVYPELRPATAGFWMFRTRIPLDIAYFGEDGRIVAIREMQPCPSPNPALCVDYPPGVPYLGTLEVNRGYFSSRGIGIGDRIELERGDGRRWPAPDSVR